MDVARSFGVLQAMYMRRLANATKLDILNTDIDRLPSYFKVSYNKIDH